MDAACLHPELARAPPRSPAVTIGVTTMNDGPVERETVVVDSGSRGGGGAILAIVVVLVLAILAFLYFGGYFGRTGKGDVNVNVGLPNVNVSLPQVNLPPVHIDNPAPAQPRQQPATNQSGK